jgi:Zn-dependent protease
MRHPNRAAWMALAGPGANLVLVLLSWATIRVGFELGVFLAPESVRFGAVVGTEPGGIWPAVAFAAGVMFSMNLLLASLNLLPLPPLDGSAAVPLVLPSATALRYQQVLLGNPAIGIVGMLVAWQVFGKVFQPLFTLAVNLLYPGTSYS